MDVPEFVSAVLDRNEGILLQALDGVSAEELIRQPSADTNPIGWLLWHLSRVEDRHVSAMEGKEQAWVTDGWHAKFGREPDPNDRGAGHTPEQVTAFRAPDLETLLAYHGAVRDYTDRFLTNLQPQDLAKQVPATRGDGTVPLATRLEMVIVDNFQHSGQIAYLRGLIRGKGWLAI